MFLAQLFIDLDDELNITELFAEPFHFMLLPRDFTLLLVSMKFRPSSAKFCGFIPRIVARKMKLAHSRAVVHTLRASIVNN